MSAAASSANQADSERGIADPAASWRAALFVMIRGTLLLLVVLCGGGVTPAFAQFAVCNQSLDVVNISIGVEQGKIFVTKGWWTIGSNQCATVIRDELASRFVYVYANDVFGQDVLNGTVPMCVADARFTIDDINNCWTRGYREAPFYEVDTQSEVRWTLFLTPNN